MVTETSLEAFESIQPDLGDKQWAVYRTIKKLQPCDNSMIAEYLKTPINSITPRTKELRDLKLVTFCDYGINRHTKRKVILWKTTKRKDI